MRLSRHLPSSPRMTSPKQLKSIPSLELNSYKIDTSSLSEKAKEIQQLKTSLQSQISQYEASQVLFHEQIQKISEQNNELTVKVKKLQAELKKIKLQHDNDSLPKTKSPLKNQQNQIKLLKITVSSLDDQVASLKKTLAQKNKEIQELSEYKKMYDIEVENKNNIMNFYEKKLAMFQRDKGVLISRYEQKISQLGSGLEITNGTIIQPQNANTQSINMATIANKTVPSSLVSHLMMSTMPKGISKNNNLPDYQTGKIIPNDTQEKIQPKSPSTKNIKFIRPSKQSNNLQQSKYTNQDDKSVTNKYQTPYKLLHASSTHESRNKDIAYSNKSITNQIHQLSISSSATRHDDMLFSRDAKVKNTPKKIQPNLEGTSKTIRNDDLFIDFIKKVSSNLRSQKIKSQNLKNFGPVRNFMNIANPLPSQTIKFLEEFPLGPTEMQRMSLQQCIQKMRRHLQKRYSRWSGSLLVELLIDKIEDVQIAYEVKSAEDQIVARLSSEEEND